MKKLSLAISLLYGTTLLSGCASTTTESLNWKVEPFQRIQHATNRPDGYYQLGRYYQGQNRLELAVEAYQKALALDPTFSEAHNGLGTIYAAQGKYDQALAEFNAVIATSPGAAHIYNNLGYLRFLQGNYADAAAAFTQATELDPTDQKARNNLDMALARGGAPMKSNQAVALAPESTTSVQLRADNDSNHVAPVAPVAPVASGNQGYQMATTSTAPKDRGVTVHASANKPASPAAGHLVADKTSTDKAINPARLAHPFPPPFAVLAPPNPKAMTVVLTSGSPDTAFEKSTATQAKALEKKPSPSSTRILQPNSAAHVIATEQSASKAQGVTTTPKVIALKEAPIKAAPLSVNKSTSLPGKRNFVFEVSNGNGIKKLAAKFGSMLSAKGLPNASLTDQKPFNQAHTVIQYRKGYLLEAARLSRHLRGFQHLAFMVESKDLSPHTDVRLILGKDASNKLRWGNHAKPITLASR